MIRDDSQTFGTIRHDSERLGRIRHDAARFGTVSARRGLARFSTARLHTAQARSTSEEERTTTQTINKSQGFRCVSQRSAFFRKMTLKFRRGCAPNPLEFFQSKKMKELRTSQFCTLHYFKRPPHSKKFCARRLSTQNCKFKKSICNALIYKTY